MRCLMFIVDGWPGDGGLGPGPDHGLYPTSDLCTPAPASSPVTPAQTPIIELHLINVKGHPVNNIFAHKVYVVNSTVVHILYGMNTVTE